jgi:hypothetical protein
VDSIPPERRVLSYPLDRRPVKNRQQYQFWYSAANGGTYIRSYSPTVQMNGRNINPDDMIITDENRGVALM